MRYPLRKEFRVPAHLAMPMQRGALRAVNALMPLVQMERPLHASLQATRIALPHCTAKLYLPKGCDQQPLPMVISYHGGAFVCKAGSCHKNQAQQYAQQLGCAVLLVDYRLAVDAPFPLPLEDCFAAYRWALEKRKISKLFLLGDSAGAALAVGVVRMAQTAALRLPDGMVLVYPVADARMQTASMQRYVDTPMWNARANARMWSLYTDTTTRHHPLVAPLAGGSFAGFPPVYVEVAQFDCLHDEGVLLAQAMHADGVKVQLQETCGTPHGYDFFAHSPYVRALVAHRIAYLQMLCEEAPAMR